MIHHICIQNDCIVFDNEIIPFGKKDIEEHLTRVLPDIFEVVIHKIGEGEVIVCGEGAVRRVLGRKLEDRLGREVKYQ